MAFITKIDFSNNRQVKQNIESITALSGATVFGVPFSYLPTGPSSTSGITATYNGVVSTFSGNSSVTNYTWYDSKMNIAVLRLSALTPSNSATTQNTGNVFTASTTTTIDGNVVALTYTGVSFDITPTVMYDLGGGRYSGSVSTATYNQLSAGTIDYTGRTIWVDVSGITRTDRLIISSVGAGPSVVDIGVDANGFVVNTASDYTLKENISTITSALDKVMKLNGVYYDWINKESGGDTKKIGFIAQDVEKVVPELVYTHNNGLKTVHYKDVTALLVEAIKELAGGDINLSGKTYLETQTILAEDNNIDLNYNGSQESSIGGGIRILNALGEGLSAEFVTDTEGNWVTNNHIKPNGLIIPFYRPSSSADLNGLVGEITRDDNFMYIKTNNGWKRTGLENF
jgi:hypothetical protein